MRKLPVLQEEAVEASCVLLTCHVHGVACLRNSRCSHAMLEKGVKSWLVLAGMADAAKQRCVLNFQDQEHEDEEATVTKGEAAVLRFVASSCLFVSLVRVCVFVCLLSLSLSLPPELRLCMCLSVWLCL